MRVFWYGLLFHVLHCNSRKLSFWNKIVCDSNEAGTLLTIYEACFFSEGGGTDTRLMAKSLGVQAQNFPQGPWLNKSFYLLMEMHIDF